MSTSKPEGGGGVAAGLVGLAGVSGGEEKPNPTGDAPSPSPPPPGERGDAPPRIFTESRSRSLFRPDAFFAVRGVAFASASAFFFSRDASASAPASREKNRFADSGSRSTDGRRRDDSFASGSSAESSPSRAESSAFSVAANKSAGSRDSERRRASRSSGPRLVFSAEATEKASDASRRASDARAAASALSSNAFFAGAKSRASARKDASGNVPGSVSGANAVAVSLAMTSARARVAADAAIAPKGNALSSALRSAKPRNFSEPSSASGRSFSFGKRARRSSAARGMPSASSASASAPVASAAASAASRASAGAVSRSARRLETNAQRSAAEALSSDEALSSRTSRRSVSTLASPSPQSQRSAASVHASSTFFPRDAAKRASKSGTTRALRKAFAAGDRDAGRGASSFFSFFSRGASSFASSSVIFIAPGVRSGDNRATRPETRGDAP